MSQGNTVINALIGATISVVLSFLPFSPIIGGGVAGYLERGDRSDGVRVGGLSGLFAAIPITLFLVLIAGFFVIVPIGMGAPRFPLLGIGFLFVFVLFFVVLYTVFLGAIGGFLGVYLVRETHLGPETDYDETSDGPGENG